jgi:4-hydroxybutyrate CoA-transferase
MLTGLAGDKERQTNKDRAAVFNNADYYITFVTPPDKDGICSFGPDIWWSPNACATAKTVIAEVDAHLPWVYGDNIHVSKIDYFIDAPAPGEKVYYAPTPQPDEYEKLQVIAALASDLIKDGDTIQVGTGSASEAVYEFLSTKNDLGIHSEIIDAGAVNLVMQGVLTGKRKNFYQGKAVGGGTTLAQYPEAMPLMEFMDHNPIFEFRDASWVSGIPNIAANDNMVAVNTSLAVDLLGQINCCSLGPVPIGGPGGQVEFCIGAHYSRGGRSIHCMLSTALNGTKSRIVPMFEPGSQVMIPMTYLDYLVTEHGTINLENKSRRERAEVLISVAHPDFQPELRRSAKALFWP